VELVGEQGYDATSIAGICDRAGISEQEFHAHFADRQSCLEVVWEAMVSDYIGTCRGAYLEAESWRAGLRAAGYAALDWLFADEARTRFFLIEVMAGGEMVRAHRDRMMNEFIEMLDAGRAEPGSRDSLSRGTAEGLTGAVYNNAIESIRAREGLAESRQRVKNVMHLIVLTYLGPEAAAEELEIPAPGEA
jgi:AcrR family transcriptional regulator